MNNYRKYLETNKAAQKRWKLANKDKINSQRRAKRLKSKQASLGERKCLNCQIYLKERCKGVRLYCSTCVRDYPLEVRRDKWRRYYYRKKSGIDSKIGV